MLSILSKDSEGVCYICHDTYFIEEHHIFFGARHRKISDKNGFTVHLCQEHHRGTMGVHGRLGHNLDLMLKRECQKTYELKHSREEFMSLIHKNYLED